MGTPEHTTLPWRWGFWKWLKDERMHQFLPLSERCEDQEDFNLGESSDVLASAEYGEKITPKDTDDRTVIDSDVYHWGDVSCIEVSDSDIDFIQTAVNNHYGLLAACKDAMEDLRMSDRDYTKCYDILDAAVTSAEDNPCPSK